MRSRCKTGLRTASTFSTGSMHNDHAVHIIFMQCLQLYYPEDNSRSSLPFHVPRSSGFGPFSRQSSHGGEMYSVCKHEFHGFFDLDTRRLVQHPRASQRSRCFTKLTRVRVECISDTLRVQPCASGDRFITSVLTVNGVGDSMVSAARRNVSVVCIPAQRLLRSGDRQCSHATRRRSYDARLVRPASQITRSAGRGGVLRPATLLARDPFFGECHNNDSPSISVGCVVQGLRITRLTSTSIHIDVPALSLVSRAYGPIGRPPTQSYSANAMKLSKKNWT